MVPGGPSVWSCSSLEAKHRSSFFHLYLGLLLPFHELLQEVLALRPSWVSSCFCDTSEVCSLEAEAFVRLEYCGLLPLSLMSNMVKACSGKNQHPSTGPISDLASVFPGPSKCLT